MSRKHNNNKKKYNKKNFKDKNGNDSFLRDGDSTGGSNDIQWWSENPQLLKDASQLSYGNILGLDVDFEIVEDAGAYQISNRAFPGLMMLEYVPIYGVSKDGNSALNNATRLVYAWLRHANSGSRNYEQSDLGTYYLAVANLYTAHAELVRLYGLASQYSKMNRYVAKGLIQALGYDFDNVINNLATLRYGINALAVRINSFAIPKSMHIFARHIMLASKFFKDASDAKAQVYGFKARQLFAWSPVDASGNPGSSLRPVMTPGYNTIGTVTVTQALTFVSNLVDSLAINEDCGLMSGDTLHAVGEDGIYHVNAIPEDYITPIEYDQVMLSQIHNATIIPMSSASASGAESQWMVQNNNNLIYNPYVDRPFGDLDDVVITEFNYLLDSGMDNPTPEFNMEATRLMAVPEVDRDTGKWTLTTVGTEIVTAVRIYDMVNGIISAAATLGTVVDKEAALGLVLKYPFDWAPIQYFADTSTGGELVLRVAGEIFNYTLINKLFLEKVNNAALLSVLNVYSLAQAKK